ncbi:hypothetical protein B0E51_06665 [Rhodanobacter sp. C05]|nr:hypothetical protein B0E51_06665 [Rhodanobacter sp. C05]
MTQSNQGHQRCAHPACHCEVQGGEAYCSEHCRKRVESPVSDQAEGCQCGHPECHDVHAAN